MSLYIFEKSPVLTGIISVNCEASHKTWEKWEVGAELSGAFIWVVIEDTSC